MHVKMMVASVSYSDKLTLDEFKKFLKPTPTSLLCFHLGINLIGVQ